MGLIDFDGYRRRLDCDEYRAKRRDVPHDAALLLELARAMEATDYISVDVMDKDE